MDTIICYNIEPLKLCLRYRDLCHQTFQLNNQSCYQGGQRGPRSDALTTYARTLVLNVFECSNLCLVFGALSTLILVCNDSFELCYVFGMFLLATSMELAMGGHI